MEIGIGLFFGMIARLILLGAQSAGSVIALQIGMASALVADPTTQQQAAITGNFLLALTVVLIFATGLDHMTLKGLVGTYAIFPPGEVPPMGDVANHASRIVADSFAVAIADDGAVPGLWHRVRGGARPAGAPDADLAGVLHRDADAAAGRPGADGGRRSPP